MQWGQGTRKCSSQDISRLLYSLFTNLFCHASIVVSWFNNVQQAWVNIFMFNLCLVIFLLYWYLLDERFVSETFLLNKNKNCSTVDEVWQEAGFGCAILKYYSVHMWVACIVHCVDTLQLRKHQVVDSDETGIKYLIIRCDVLMFSEQVVVYCCLLLTPSTLTCASSFLWNLTSYTIKYG
jgi:hypothetical protein